MKNRIENSKKQVESKEAKGSILSGQEQDELILEFRIKARKLGRSILRKWNARLDLQEVDSIVDLSLCEAAKRFDPTRGASFMTFLYYHLKGNLIRTVSAAAQANFVPGQHLDEEKRPEGPVITALEVVEAISSVAEIQPDEMLLKKELVHLSKDACNRLDPLEQQVIERLFLKGEQLMDIASSLGYSRCHISRVKRKALENLHSDMERTLDAEKVKVQAPRLQALRKVKRRKRSAVEATPLQAAA